MGPQRVGPHPPMGLINPSPSAPATPPCGSSPPIPKLADRRPQPPSEASCCSGASVARRARTGGVSMSGGSGSTPPTVLGRVVHGQVVEEDREAVED